MAGKIIIDTIDTDNAFITLNVQQSLIATMNVSGIYSNTGVKMIGANGTVSNTAITGLVTAAQIATVANTQITGNITSSQITSNPTFYGNVSVTGAIGVGGATPAASGSGITFPAIQSASSNANTLDDYEEGTFNPTIQNENSTAAFTYTNRGGNYTKVGRLVEVWFYMNISVTSAGTGLAGLQVSSLPFTPSSDNLTNSNYSRGGVALRHPTATTAFNLHFSGDNPSATTFLFWAALGAGSTGGATTGLQTGVYSGYVIYEV